MLEGICAKNAKPQFFNHEWTGINTNERWIFGICFFNRIATSPNPVLRLFQWNSHAAKSEYRNPNAELAGSFLPTSAGPGHRGADLERAGHNSMQLGLHTYPTAFRISDFGFFNFFRRAHWEQQGIQTAMACVTKIPGICNSFALAPQNDTEFNEWRWPNKSGL